MKAVKIGLILLIVLVMVVAPIMASANTKKEAGPSQGRKIWDIIWKFINFFVLAFVIVKYGRKPLKDFLVTHSAEIGHKIEVGQSELAEAEAEYEEAETKLAKIADLIVEMKEYIQQDAERTKAHILSDAQEKAELIMNEANERAHVMVRSAQAELKAELVELALTEAEKLIREGIKTDDEQRLIEEYLVAVNQPSPA